MVGEAMVLDRIVSSPLRRPHALKKQWEDLGSQIENSDCSEFPTRFLERSNHFQLKDGLLQSFPNGWTSSCSIFSLLEGIMPASKKSKYLELENSEYENVIDFYISSRSDVFVPAIPGLFYANTVGKRIALGKPQVLVPAEISGTSGLSTDYISPYISKKNHLAYSCFC
ncbi:hypothetical protein HA466_0319800 [Hirschfeldia incana]|nr:hypothetical protein HA466_0319800 [Hirschfeldia incana]